MNYDEALAYIHGLLAGARPPLVPERRLDRISRLLDALVVRRPPFPVVLVAGTKGQGSTATVLAEILLPQTHQARRRSDLAGWTGGPR